MAGKSLGLVLPQAASQLQRFPKDGSCHKNGTRGPGNGHHLWSFGGDGFNLFVNPVFTHIIPFTLAIVINGIVIVIVVIDSHC